jgi:hypothetical protein
MIAMSILTLLENFGTIQLYSKQQMLYNVLFLPNQVNHQTSRSVG